MAGPTQYYVDPSIDANSGAGTIGDPYGDLQYALNTITRNATSGDQINIKSGTDTDEVLTAALSLATYGTPAADAPLIFRGYSSAANDGGIGGISGDGTYSIFNSSSTSFIHFIDLHLHNCGSQIILTIGSECTVIGCELDNTTTDGVVHATNAYVSNNYFHDIGRYGVRMNTGGALCIGNYFKNGTTNKFDRAIFVVSAGSSARRNIISVDSTSDAIYLNTLRCNISENSILSDGGSGDGIVINTASSAQGTTLVNNLIEGFTTGTGINLLGVGVRQASVVAGNAVFNCGTAYDLGDVVFQTDNETLSETPFAKSVSDSFENRLTYFSPADTGNVLGGAYP